MKEIRNIVISLVILAVCIALSGTAGFNPRDILENIHINYEAVLKVAIIITFLLVVKYLLKLLVGLIRFKKAATVVTILKSAIDYITIILIVVWSLQILGADINGIIAGLGILALIIGTGAEGIIEDLLTGVFLMVEGEYKVGDIIEVDDFLGRVSAIGIRTTTLVDYAGNEKIFNNSDMTNILNRSTFKSLAVVDIDLPSDMEIEKVTKADYGDIQCLGLEEIKEDGIVIRFTKEADEEKIYDVRRQMNVVILKKLRELGLK